MRVRLLPRQLGSEDEKTMGGPQATDPASLARMIPPFMGSLEVRQLAVNQYGEIPTQVRSLPHEP